MRCYAILALLLSPCVWACDYTDCNGNPTGNVNSRYTIESVDITGKASSQELKTRLSKKVRNELERLVGQKYNEDQVDSLGEQIKGELHAAKVSSRVERGQTPEFIRLFYETRGRRLDEDATVTKLSYHARQGWTGGVEFATNVAPGLQMVAGIQSDGDSFVAREAGYNARLTQSIGDHVRLRLSFEDFHEQWNSATISALAERPDLPGIYRTRREYEPSVTVAVSRYVSFTTGVSFGELQTQYPLAHDQSVNASDSTVQFHHSWINSHDARQEIEATYNLRAAVRALGSDFVYVRHALKASYSFGTEHSLVLLRLVAGRMSGTAPLYERFTLGNTATLRGWNKYELDPVGGSRALQGSVDYRYRVFGVFYDIGSVSDRRRPAKVRNSAGASIALGGLRNGITLAVAFPLREGRIDPIFIMSTNF
jgi:outer membrane protein assembly factor BamA